MRRKLVLATDIAETSLTVEGVRIVVDSGLARKPRFDTRTGMTRLQHGVGFAGVGRSTRRAGPVEPSRESPTGCGRRWSTPGRDRQRAAGDHPPSISPGWCSSCGRGASAAADSLFLLDRPPAEGVDRGRGAAHRSRSTRRFGGLLTDDGPSHGDAAGSPPPGPNDPGSRNRRRTAAWPAWWPRMLDERDPLAGNRPEPTRRSSGSGCSWLAGSMPCHDITI